MTINKNFFFIILSLFFINQRSFAKKTPILVLSQSDILITREKGGNGLHLYVKKIGDIKSIMLIQYDTSKNSSAKVLRATTYNKINGNEVFRSNGRKMEFSYIKAQYSLIATRTEENEVLGECFHIYIPQKVYFGGDAKSSPKNFTFKNLKIRAFEKKSCDYSGAYLDYNFDGGDDIEAEISFLEISSKSRGVFVHARNSYDLTEKLTEEIDLFNSNEKIDIVFAIDATQSMKDDFAELKKNWLSRFEKQMKKFLDVRIALVLYKDYGDEFQTNGLPVKNWGFLKNAKAFSKAIKSAFVNGGGDREEAVYEALYFCATEVEWRKDSIKKIILIGDAPPRSCGEKCFDFGQVLAEISKNKISVDCFLISDSNEKSSEMKTVKKSKATEELLKSVESLDAK